MRFEASQHMRLGQQMKLAPRMIQSMEILQMPLAELQERIEQELENNPTLEQVEGDADAAAREESRETEREAAEGETPLSIDDRGGAPEFARLETYARENPEVADAESSGSDAGVQDEPGMGASREFPGAGGPRAAAGERDAKMDAMASAPARAMAAGEQLREQWRLADVGDRVREAGELIIAYLDDDGYLRTPFATLLDRGVGGRESPPLTEEELANALRAIQLHLEPVGVGARDVRECLGLQIEAALTGDPRSDPGLAAASGEAMEDARVLVDGHLDDLTQNRLPRVAERTGLSMPRIRAALEALRKLSLAPGRRLTEERVAPIVPDAIVEHDPDTDEYVSYLNDWRLPNLRVNREYALMARDRKAAKPAREFLRRNLSNAQWLIDAIEQRRGTLLRVLGVVTRAQRDFFDFGPQALKPLPMTQVAAQLGIHVATVSRAVADKHVLTPRGIVPLRKFFSGGLHARGDGESPGEEMAWEAVKSALREVIDAEDKKSPLSDDALAEAMKKRGIDIARRTVAKYRDQMGIPSARMRRTF